jgi:hypothetical protein
MTPPKSSPVSSLVVWHGHPTGVFPAGEHVYPADLGLAKELLAALHTDFAESYLVSTSVLASNQPHPWPFRLAGLRAFLQNHASRLDEVLSCPTVVANTREHGRHLVARLRALGAPKVIVDHQQAELERVSSAQWKPAVDIANLVPDVLGTASVVNVQARASHGWEAAVEADIGNLILLAASCCVLPGAVDEEESGLDGLEWTSLLDFDREEAPIPAGSIRVRPGVDFDAVETLEFADAGNYPRACAQARTLLRVVVPSDEGG